MPFFAKEADPSGETGPADGAVSVTPCTREWTGSRDLWMKSILDHFIDDANGTANEWLKKNGLPGAAPSLSQYFRL